jgi:hypothetical protein
VSPLMLSAKSEQRQRGQMDLKKWCDASSLSASFRVIKSMNDSIAVAN